MTDTTALDRTALDANPLPEIKAGAKETHGKILIIAGSRSVPGAALLAAHGAMRAGAGASLGRKVGLRGYFARQIPDEVPTLLRQASKS